MFGVTPRLCCRNSVASLLCRFSSYKRGSKLFTVLGIETSCDDTGAAVVRSDGTILSNVVYSQNSLHEKFGGIVPGLAMEAHKQNIRPVIEEAIMKAGLTEISKVDAIAVTQGPGLEICLRVGMRAALQLAREYHKPFLTVHHLEGHCMVARLAAQRVSNESNDVHYDNGVGRSIKSAKDLPTAFTPCVDFPFLSLLVSGGHSQIMLCHGLGDFTILGEALDDSLGESFDKAARLMGINKGFVNGGPLVEAMARHGDPSVYASSMTVPMLRKRDCNFSYAGLKNSFRLAVLQARRENGLNTACKNAPASTHAEVDSMVELPQSVAADLSAAFQQVAFRHGCGRNDIMFCMLSVEDRVYRAMAYVHDKGLAVRNLVVVGGVAANMELRKTLVEVINRANDELVGHSSAVKSNRLCGASEWALYFPPPALCTDNGVMTAWAGVERLWGGMELDIGCVADGVNNEAHARGCEGDDHLEPRARWPIGPTISPADKALFRKRKASTRVSNQ